MATTEQKSGFRLPWSSDQSTDGSALAETLDRGGDSRATDADRSHPPTSAPAVAAVGDPVASPPAAAVGDPVASPPAATASPVPSPARRPNRLMAELTKAMQAAAEASREEALTRLNADAKACVELIHAGSAEEATALRQRADGDVAAVREWSKAEIARIREETEVRISNRKAALEQELEDQAARIERRIERVQGRVATFEAEMAAFFETLLAEDDPTRFAGLAESLPEPPNLEDELESDEEPAAPLGVAESAISPAAPAEADRVSEALEEPATGDPAAEEAEGSDPRLTELGLTAETAEAAEAEAFAAVDLSNDDEIPAISDDAIAARLAGFSAMADEPGDAEVKTRVVVTGLVSVASIAAFKRHLARLGGVQSVGVSSGPDGEFVFAVSHAGGLSLKDAIPALQGFQARVTGTDDGVVNVSAHDPESDS